MAGAAGYVLKQVRGTDLVDGIRRVAAGESLLDPAVTTRVLERLRQRRPTTSWPALTDQERRILDLIAEGLTNRQIGERMFLAEKTVKNYVSNLLAKLGMSRRTEAAAYAARLSERTQTATTITIRPDGGKANRFDTGVLGPGPPHRWSLTVAWRRRHADVMKVLVIGIDGSDSSLPLSAGRSRRNNCTTGR